MRHGMTTLCKVAEGKKKLWYGLIIYSELYFTSHHNSTFLN
jgi:hypothetical protein